MPLLAISLEIAPPSNTPGIPHSGGAGFLKIFNVVARPLLIARPTMPKDQVIGFYVFYFGGADSVSIQRDKIFRSLVKRCPAGLMVHDDNESRLVLKNPVEQTKRKNVL